MLWLHCEGINPFDGNTDVTSTDAVASEDFSYQVDLSGQNQLILNGINSEIMVRGDETATMITIEGKKQVGSETMADATAHLENLEVRIEEKLSEVVVETRQPSNGHGRSYIVDYSITVPGTLKVSIHNVNGAVSIRSTQGDVRVENVNSEIELNEINSNVSAHVVNGRISGSVIMPLDGTIDMSLVNGNINLEIPRETSFEFKANVTNGRITVSNVA